MTSVCFCICTYNRPDQLTRLLASIDQQEIVSTSDDKVTLIVVDNSPDRSSSEAVAGYKQQGRFRLMWFHEPVRGLCWARNTSLARALEQNPDYLAFVDDDEFVAHAWLEAHLGAIKRTQAAASVGPVYPCFERPPPDWAILGAYSKELPQTDGWVTDGYTCNALVSAQALIGAGLRFDERFNQSGGEDTLFFRGLQANGGRIAWAEQAVVYDFIPSSRMTLGWCLARWSRTGNTEANLGRADPHTFAGRINNGSRGAARLAVGLAALAPGLVLWAWGAKRLALRGLFTASRGAGLIATAFGRTFSEYGHANYRPSSPSSDPS